MNLLIFLRKTSLCLITASLLLSASCLRFGGESVVTISSEPQGATEDVSIAPNATDGTLATNEDTPATGTLLASDVDGDALTFSIVTNGTLGSVTITNTASGAFTYTPNTDANGTDFFTFVANDGTEDSDIGTVIVTIAAQNDAPTISNISNQTTTISSAGEGATLSTITFTVDEGGGADEDGQNLTITATSSNQNVITDANITKNYTPDGSSDATGGDLDISFIAGDSGTATITVTVQDDGTGNLTATDTFDVTINLPSSINTRLWLSADQMAYNTGVTLATDGQTVATWADRSGNNNDATGGGGTASPTWTLDGGASFGNLPVITFDGTDDFFSVPIIDLTATDGVTVFVVGNVTGGPQVFFEYSENPFSYTDSFYLMTNSSSLGTVQSYAVGDVGNSGFTTTEPPSYFVTSHVFTALIDKSLTTDEGTMWVEGTVAAGNRSGANNNNTNNFGNRVSYIGSRGGTVLFLSGNIAELILYDSALSAANRQGVECYLGKKYGFSIDVGHGCP